MNLNMSISNYWKGAPLSMLYGSESPWDNAELPPVQPGHNHAVLYHIPSDGVFAGDRPPKPQIGQDKWDQHHVRLPCSKHSLYPVTNEKGETRLRKRWAIIENTLKKPIRNSKQLADAILAYNTKFKNRWKFRALHKLFNECLEEEESQYFFDVTLPEIMKLVLDLPKLVQAPIPLLKQHKNLSISLSQQQIASLLANAFFCTFPRRNSMKTDSEYASYPFINFNSLYETSGSDDVIEKLKSICHYFRRVCMEVPAGVVTFARRSVVPRRVPHWEQSACPLAALPLHVNPRDTIEEADGLIQVDFANNPFSCSNSCREFLWIGHSVSKRGTVSSVALSHMHHGLSRHLKRFKYWENPPWYLGGGVLGHGCVQEEIRFVICPELMVSMLFTEVLRPNEAVMIIGAERYSRYVGYGYTFEWAGPFEDRTPRDCSGRRRVAVLAIDALLYSDSAEEFRCESIDRELKKAWVGFSFYADEEGDGLNYPGVATGNWGCGAFGGTPHLKSLLQAMACVEARRPMAYYTFGDAKLAEEIIKMYCLLVKHNVTVGELYKLLQEFCDGGSPPSRLHFFLSRKLEDESSSLATTDASENDLMERGLLTDSIKTECYQSPGKYLMDISIEEELEREVIDQIDTNKNIPAKQTTSDKTASANTIALSDSSQSSDTPRLFREMEKLEHDESLNFNKNNTLPLSSKANTSSCSLTGMDAKIPMDVSMDVKKKISKKITDYFAKKSI